MRIIVRSGLAAAATTLVLAGVAAPALAPTAAAVTAAVARPAAAPPVSEELLSVSCPAAKYCLAVGVNHDGFGGAGGPLAEIWNGATWHAVAVRLPAGATGGDLSGVDCLSARDCVAVGFYDKSSADQFALADTWNGTKWTPATAPAPGGTDTALSAVSCVSASRCVAVGSYTPKPGTTIFSAEPLAEIWNGRTWTQARPPTPLGLYSALDAVSCPAASTCFATGVYEPGEQSGWLIESWNGRTWTLMASTSAVGFDELTGVSCTSRDSCAAVGSTGGGGGSPESSLTEFWNGKSWSARAVPWPAGTSYPMLLGVSCPAANRCVAVGTIDPDPFLDNGTNTGRAAAVTWNGKAWTATSVPAPAAGEASVFSHVTCLTATDCAAVGQVGPTETTNGTGLSGFWNGKSWRLVTVR